MEKKQQQHEEAKEGKIWDCGSSLYDSFELKSFERHLYSAIHSRTLSMPHLSDRRRVLPEPELPSNPRHHPKKSPPSNPRGHPKKSPPSKIARSFRKLLRSVFKWKKQNNTITNTREEDVKCKDGFCVVGAVGLYNTPISTSLSTILEAQEFDGRYLRSPARRTASNRFMVTDGASLWA